MYDRSKAGVARGRHFALTSLAIGIVLASTATGCVAARPSEPAASSPSPVAGSPSATPPPSPTATTRPEPTATHQPTPTASSLSPETSSPPASTSPGTLPSVGPVPAGAWSAIRWIGPIETAGLPAAVNGAGDGYRAIYGWSGGFIAFKSDPVGSGGTAGIETAVSRDGLQWSAAGRLTVTSRGMLGVTGLVQGPGGLLAEAREVDLACGGTPPIEALWSSIDGGAWQPVDVHSAFGTDFALTLSGGSHGYIATGNTAGGAGDRVWTSDDGRTWRRAALPGRPADGIIVTGGVALGQRYVLGGSVAAPAEGCGGSATRRPSIWSSPDGRAWTRGTLPAAPTGDRADLRLSRIGDEAVLAVATIWTGGNEPTEAAWVSSDGRSWRSTDPAPFVVSQLVTNGSRGVAVSGGGETPLRIVALNGLDPVDLASSGKGPATSWRAVGLGPTGLLVPDHAGALWLGVPEA